MTKEEIDKRSDSCIFDQICTKQAKTGCPDGICLKFRDAFSLKSFKRRVSSRQLEMEI